MLKYGHGDMLGGIKMIYNKLWGRIVEKYGSQKAFAKIIGKTEQTLSKKMNDPEGLSQKDMIEWGGLLDIDVNDFGSYFFPNILSKS